MEWQSKATLSNLKVNHIIQNVLSVTNAAYLSQVCCLHLCVILCQAFCTAKLLKLPKERIHNANIYNRFIYRWLKRTYLYTKVT